MANNRIAIVCKDCKVGLPIAKYYPLGGFIAGDGEDNAGWYQPTDTRHTLNNFFIRHKHSHDRTNAGGSQYFLGYESDGLDWKYEQHQEENHDN